MPLTARLPRRAVISGAPEEGVVDEYQRVWGHPGLHVGRRRRCAGDPGVNPSLTITALAEHALSHWPRRGEPDPRPTPGTTQGATPSA
ncbi:hypothetical protein CTI14_17705 [Methylobacterium radiotolerans]|nr:hypothetical protein CTI14_17705 [Methylobacterium radiotolerans]